MSGPVTQPPEQIIYARWLEWGTRIGLVVLVLSFAAYMGGIGEPLIPVEQLPDLWTLPVDRFLQASGMPSGWGWLGLLARSDIATLSGIVILASCSLPAVLALVPLYWRRGDRRLAWLCLTVVAVLLLAASGLLAGGH